jgi:hypothetical protein
LGAAGSEQGRDIVAWRELDGWTGEEIAIVESRLNHE